MPTSDCTTDLPSSDAQLQASLDARIEEAPIEARPAAFDGASKRLRALFFGFAATVTLGLALGSWYVGLRIVAVNRAAPSHAGSAGRENPTPVPVPAEPPAGLYLQLAGLGPMEDAGLVKSLEAQGLHARPSGDQHNARILIGPFSTHDEMEQAQRTLQSEGVLTSGTAH
ncbi:MAG: SPOR domain-containing protein [Bryobacteraceae bacterium]